VFFLRRSAATTIRPPRPHQTDWEDAIVRSHSESSSVGRYSCRTRQETATAITTTWEATESGRSRAGLESPLAATLIANTVPLPAHRSLVEPDLASGHVQNLGFSWAGRPDGHRALRSGYYGAVGQINISFTRRRGRVTM
jgi:hypothetical protein